MSRTQKQNMSSLALILSLLAFSGTLWAKPAIYDAEDCALKLSPALVQKLVDDSSPRQDLGGVATYVLGDQKSTKLLDVKGDDPRAISGAIIRFLRFQEDLQVNPNLQPAIETVLRLGREIGAVFSIGSWMMPNAGRTIRMSLDMSETPGDKLTVWRLPNLEIRNGAHARRIDIDITPERLTLLTATTQALTGGGKLVVSEPASHSLGLEIIGTSPQHPVIDAFMASANFFIGANAKPNLSALLSLAEKLAREVYPQTQDLTFRTQEENRAMNQGHGWQAIH